MPGQAFYLHYVRSDVNRLVDTHRHDYAEVFWLTDGQCRHALNGREELLPTGVVLMLRPADAHRLSPLPGERFAFTNLVFAPAHWANLRRRHPARFARLFDLAAAAPCRLALNCTALEDLNRQAEQLLDGPADVFRLEWFLYNLAALAGATQRPPAPDWLREACARIREPEWFSQGVAGFVKAAGYGHEYVCRSAKRHLGKTPGQIVTEARMRWACRELMTTSRSVGEIALACGFSNTSQFHNRFRRHTGTTPLSYRQRAQTPI